MAAKLLASDLPCQLEVMVVTSYPFLFSFRDLIAGNGYIANVTSAGRVLLFQEDDGDWWLFGVQPGGIAGGDPDRNIALNEFKKNYLSVLLDIAAEARSYEEFAAEVKRLFAQVNEPTASEWVQALQLVRGGATKYPGVVTVKAADDHKPMVEIALITQKTATPAANADVEPNYSKAA